MKVVGYIRVSTEEQATGGHSLVSQRSRIEAYCSLYGHELVGVEEDAGWSAGSMDRPAIKRALAAVSGREVEGLIVVRLDRLTRCLADLLDVIKLCEEHGNGKGRARSPAVAFMCVEDHLDTSTPTGLLMVHIFGVLAEWERSTIGVRIADTMQTMAANGLRVGSIPHGYRLGDDGKTLVADEVEKAAIRMARRLKADGASLRFIGRALEEAGHANKRGGRWSASSVKLMLAAKV